MSTSVAAMIALIGIVAIYWAATGLGLFVPKDQAPPA